VQFGIIQLPFFACNVLLLKFAAASRHNGLIFLASIAGLCLNVLLNFILMKHMGVAGIALATTLSMMASAALLLILAFWLRHIDGVDLIVIVLGWLLFLTLVLCLHYQSYPGVAVTVLAMLFLVAGSWRRFFRFTSFVAPRMA
jgi:peptidoglycan biosynthesis protein MviN/MurJ (putative lipid II flippase)